MRDFLSRQFYTFDYGKLLAVSLVTAVAAIIVYSMLFGLLW